MKVVYLILAHKNPEQLSRMIKALTYRDEEFFIHIDKRRKLKPFLESLKPHDHNVIRIINNRVPVYFVGGYGQIEAILNSLAEILSSSRNFDYLVLLSGQDYPIKRAEQIQTHFSRNSGKEFLERFPLPADPDKARVEINFRMSRVQGYHFDDLLGGKYIKGTNRLANWILPAKEFPKGYTPYWGSVYWRVTYKCAKFVADFVNNDHEFVRFFRFAQCPDEYIFHTIILNSPFSENVVDDNLTYIDWSTGFHPKVLTTEDFHNLADSEKLIARKFDINTDSRVLDLIDTKLLDK